MLARSASEAYSKNKAQNPDLSEAEISQKLFMQRCSSGNLNKADQLRFKKYLEAGETVDPQLKLCLAMVHILLNITEADGKTYQTIRKTIEEELSRSGHKISSDQ